MNTKWLQTRQTKYGTYATVYTLIVLAALVIVNLLANDRNKTYDTTSNKQYSLSEQTLKILNDLKQDVKLTYFDSASGFERAKDQLGRYSTVSRKVTVDYVDPVQKVGVAQAMGVTRRGQLFVQTGGKTEEAAGLGEEDVTSALVRVLKGTRRNACFVQGSGEGDLGEMSENGLSSAKEALTKNNYQPRPISLLEKPEVPKDCTVLIVAGPRLAYPETEVNAIKSYIEGGGHALILVGPVLKMAKQQVSENPALENLLKGWGITLENNLILDAGKVSQMFGLSPIVPLVTRYENHPITRTMKGVVTAFPLSRSIVVATGGANGAQTLMSTGTSSFATTNLSSAEIQIDPNKDRRGPFPLGAIGTVGADPKTQGRFVVVGSANWIANNALDLPQVANRDLFLNTMNWLSADEDLISIRPKDPEDRRLTMTASQRNTMVMVSQFLIPLTMLVLGISVWWRRR